MSNANPSGVRRGEDVAIAERQREILDLRKSGMTFAAIAAQLGYADHSGVHDAYQKAMKAMLEPANDIRALEAARLDALWSVWYPQALQPASKNGPAALDRCLRIMDRRAKLLGLDAPTQVRVTVSDKTQQEIDQLVAELAALDVQVVDPTKGVLALEAPVVAE